MGVLATWIVGLVTNFVAFFGLQLSKKTIYAAAAITAMLALTGAMILAIKASLTGIAVGIPFIPSTAYYFIPQNAAACISAIFAARFARFVYDYNMRALEVVASIN